MYIYLNWLFFCGTCLDFKVERMHFHLLFNFFYICYFSTGKLLLLFGLKSFSRHIQYCRAITLHLNLLLSLQSNNYSAHDDQTLSVQKLGSLTLDVEAQWPHGKCTHLQIEHFRFEPGGGHCVMFLSKTLFSQCLSP